MIKVQECLNSAYAGFASGVIQAGKLGGRLTSKICEQAANTDRLTYAAEFVFGSFVLFFPKSTRIGCANMLGLSNSLQILGISNDIKTFLHTPLKAYTNPETRLEAFKSLSFVVAGACALLKIADEIALLSLGKIASKTGSWVLFSLPFSDANHQHFHHKLCNCRLDTLFYGSLAVGYALSLCNTAREWNKAQAMHAESLPQSSEESKTEPRETPIKITKPLFPVNSKFNLALNVTATATYVSLLVGEKLFPKHHRMISGLLAVTTMGIGWGKTYYPPQKTKKTTKLQE